MSKSIYEETLARLEEENEMLKAQNYIYNLEDILPLKKPLEKLLGE